MGGLRSVQSVSFLPPARGVCGTILSLSAGLLLRMQDKPKASVANRVPPTVHPVWNPKAKTNLAGFRIFFGNLVFFFWMPNNFGVLSENCAKGVCIVPVCSVFCLILLLSRLHGGVRTPRGSVKRHVRTLPLYGVSLRTLGYVITDPRVRNYVP